MAAVQAAARNMFRLIGFSDDASLRLVGDEGLNTPDAFLDLTDERIKSIVYAIRRPGGALVGHGVSERAQHHFTLAAKLIQYWVRTKRAIVFTAVQLNSFPQIERQMALELAWNNDDYKPVPFTAAELKHDPEGGCDTV